MSERENGQLTTSEASSGIAPDILGGDEDLEHEGKHLTLLHPQKSAGGANVYL